MPPETTKAQGLPWAKIGVVLTLGVIVTLFFVFDLKSYLSLEYLQANRARFQDFYASHTLATISAFMGIYVLVTALSLPGAALMSLMGGALFGFTVGAVMVSFASSIGATLAFLVARFLLRDMVQAKFGDRLAVINRGIETEGAFYLFTLRLIPAIPFFVINLAMGLTPIRVLTFYGISQLGMLPGTLVYVNAGVRIGEIQSLGDILSPALIASFVALGVFPLIAKKAMNFVKKKRATIS